MLVSAMQRNEADNRLQSLHDELGTMIAEEERNAQELPPSPDRILVKHADMAEEMRKNALDIASQAVGQLKVERDIAGWIKAELDKMYGPLWHCIVGKSYGSMVSHEKGHFLYCYIDGFAILVFRSG